MLSFLINIFLLSVFCWFLIRFFRLFRLFRLIYQFRKQFQQTFRSRHRQDFGQKSWYSQHRVYRRQGSTSDEKDISSRVRIIEEQDTD